MASYLSLKVARRTNQFAVRVGPADSEHADTQSADEGYREKKTRENKQEKQTLNYCFPTTVTRKLSDWLRSSGGGKFPEADDNGGRPIASGLSTRSAKKDAEDRRAAAGAQGNKETETKSWARVRTEASRRENKERKWPVFPATARRVRPDSLASGKTARDSSNQHKRCLRWTECVPLGEGSLPRR